MEGDGLPVAKPEAFWGPILLSARLHATTAEVWSAIKGYAEQQGVELPQGMFGAVNRMRSLAIGLRNSGERLDRAADSDAITSKLIGTQLYARSPLERSLSPAYHARFEMVTYDPDGNARTSWYTLEYDNLPLTVGDLRQEIGLYAESLGGAYGVGVGDITTMELGEF